MNQAIQQRDPETLCACRACGGTALSEIYHLPAIPVQSCILLKTAEEAVALPRAPLTLMFCEDCGFIFNSRFDLDLVNYHSATEESQHFSGTFNAFARGLTDTIAARYDLKDRFTLEIGCGKGDFLRQLADATGTRALGVDPGFIPDRFVGEGGADIRFLKEYFDPERIDEAPDFVVCRHTLEHIDRVAEFLADIAQLKVPPDGTTLFFETPDVRRVLEEGAFWDIYNEHCSYFSMGSHARLFRRAGYDITGLEVAYGDQYILQYAVPRQQGAELENERDLDDMRRLAEHFPAVVERTRDFWAETITQRRAKGERVALWGGGSKAVSFITTNGLEDAIDVVVDINPFKQGRYLPGTAIRVSAPGDLVASPPDLVIAMNSLYLDEIGQSLKDLDIASDLTGL